MSSVEQSLPDALSNLKPYLETLMRDVGSICAGSCALDGFLASRQEGIRDLPGSGVAGEMGPTKGVLRGWTGVTGGF